MPLVLTERGTVACGHGGTAKLSGTGKVTVGGAKVMCEADVSAWSILPGCSQVNSDKGQVPCVSIQSVTGGTSKLSVGGSPVLLANMTATSKEGKPANDVSAKSAGQNVLSAAEA